MKIFTTIALVFLLFVLLPAKELVVSGTQNSQIQYQLKQKIVPFSGIEQLMVSFVLPATFHSPTYNQDVSNVTVDFSIPPLREEKDADARGNQIRRYYWEAPQGDIMATVKLDANNHLTLKQVVSRDKFPEKFSAEFRAYLQPSEQVQSGDPNIIAKARALSSGYNMQIEAVKAILHYVVDNMHYVLIPEQYDALYSFNSGKGNCQNYSHLSAALLRAVGIPTRIVNGITLKKGYDVKMEQSLYSFAMAQGRHSWVEVYFTDLGWVPFDPQQTEFFVSNRYLRIEVGVDNQETINDGLVRWTASAGAAEQVPGLEEGIEAKFVQDNININSLSSIAGPKNLMLVPELLVASLEKPTPVEPEKPKPLPVKEPEKIDKPAEPLEEIDYAKLKYDKPAQFGNMEFPVNFDFLAARLGSPAKAGKQGQLERNFMVETAEYVTGKNQFSQMIVLEAPVKLSTIDLALHYFGGQGLVWLDLSEDENGMPGPPQVSSKKVVSNLLPRNKGYDWVKFDFSRDGLILSPGKYWVTFNNSGSTIMNWFYTYGKPVGPVEGTRSRENGQRDWARILSFEFNYRVSGLAAM